MSTIVTRAGKGSALTHNEVDANFNNLNNDKIEAAQSVTLTNKTLSTGTAITAGTINNATIGASTPSSGAFTTLSASSTVSGTGFSTYLASPPAIGGTAAAAGSFTTLSATGVTTVQAGTVSAPAITTSGDTNTGIFFPAADTIAFTEGGVESMRIDSAGNVGLGVTPSAWSNYKALQFGGGSVSSYEDNIYIELAQNSFYTAGAYKYVNSGFASKYQQNGGTHQWYRAASGTAGGTISFTQAMTLDASGNLALGGTSVIGGARADFRQNSNGNYSTTFTTATTKALLHLRDLSDVATYPTTFSTLLFGAGDLGAAYTTITCIRESSQNSAIAFGTASGSSNTTERMRLDSSGNLGLGVTPSAYSGLTAGRLEVGAVGNSLFSNGSTNFWLTTNTNYETGPGYKYATTGVATMYLQTAGQHQWHRAASGTAGNTITFTQAMTLDASGNLLVGGTSSLYASAGRGNIEINGSSNSILALTIAGSVTNVSYFYSTSTDLEIVANGSRFMRFTTNGSERARIDASGYTQFNSNLVMPYQGAPTSKAAAATLTGAELVTGILNTTGTTYTITLPTGANIEGALTWSANNVSLDWYVINTASGTITIGANGNTTLGSLTIATGTSAHFRIRRTAANTFTVYRL